jgi:hypothetical protein
MIKKAITSAISLGEITLDPQAMRRRIRQRLSPWEFFAVVFCIFMLVGIAIVQQTSSMIPFDYSVFINSAAGDFSHYYYAYWGAPLFSLFHILPAPLGFILWDMLNLAGIWLATRIFGGNLLFALLNYQMLYIFFYGQAAGVIVGGLALLWWGLAERWWWLAGIGLTIAITKYQMGVPLGLTLWLLADRPWRERFQVLVLPIIVAIVSLLVYPGWPIHLLQNFAITPPDTQGSLSLWRWIGPWALVLWIPALASFFIPKTPKIVTIGLVVATSALALPYFQQTDLVLLYVLPIGWFGLLGNFGYLYIIYSWPALQALVIIPLLAYLKLLIAYGRYFRSRQPQMPPF